MCLLQSFISLHPHSVLKDQHTPATSAIVVDTCTGCSTMGKSHTNVDDTECRLVVNMRQAGLKWKSIMDITSRSKKKLKYFMKLKKRDFLPVSDTEHRLVVNMKQAGLTWKTIHDITSRSYRTLNTIKTPRTKKNPKSNPKDAPKKLPTKIMSTCKGG